MHKKRIRNKIAKRLKRKIVARQVERSFIIQAKEDIVLSKLGYAFYHLMYACNISRAIIEINYARSIPKDTIYRRHYGYPDKKAVN